MRRTCKQCKSDWAREKRAKEVAIYGDRSWALWTHCIRGHEFTLENTYRSPAGGRRCRTCARLRDRGELAPTRKGGAE